MVERRKVQSHLGFRRRDPPAQLEEGQQAFPSTRLITLPKVVITDPHAQIREPNLQQRHDLVFGVIQFLHFAFACLELFLLAKNESEGSTGLFTVVQLSFPSNAGGFKQDAPMMHFPLCLQLPGFDGQEARLTGLADGLQCRDLRQQVLLPLFPDHDLLLAHLVRLARLAEPFATLCRQSMQMSQALLQGRPLFDQFRVHDWLLVNALKSRLFLP